MNGPADLLERALTIYEVDGIRLLEGWARSVPVAPFVEELRCEGCATRKPHIGGICVVCWAAGWARIDPARAKTVGSSG
jgi:hypothetical protein